MELNPSPGFYHLPSFLSQPQPQPQQNKEDRNCISIDDLDATLHARFRQSASRQAFMEVHIDIGIDIVSRLSAPDTVVVLKNLKSALPGAFNLDELYDLVLMLTINAANAAKTPDRPPVIKHVRQKYGGTNGVAKSKKHTKREKRDTLALYNVQVVHRTLEYTIEYLGLIVADGSGFIANDKVVMTPNGCNVTLYRYRSKGNVTIHRCGLAAYVIIVTQAGQSNRMVSHPFTIFGPHNNEIETFCDLPVYDMGTFENFVALPANLNPYSKVEDGRGIQFINNICAFLKGILYSYE